MPKVTLLRVEELRVNVGFLFLNPTLFACTHMLQHLPVINVLSMYKVVRYIGDLGL